MKFFVPPRPAGTDAFARWCQAVWDRLFSQEGQLCDSATVSVRRTSKGTFLDAAGPASPFSAQAFVFRSMAADYLICRMWGGSPTPTMGTTDVYIAKPIALRFSIISEIIAGATVNYTQYSLNAQSRHAVVANANPAREEDQVITPRYLTQQTLTGNVIIPGSIIYAMPAQTFVNNPSGQPIGLIDMNGDAREWTESAG